MPIVGFDHFIILVNELAVATDAFRRLGFEVRAGGEHPAFGSQNALIPLADGTYFELLAFKDSALAAQTFWGDAVRKLRVREGYGAYVLASNDLAQDVAQIRARGLDIADAKPGMRARPDGQRVAWYTAIAGGTPTGILPFLIQDDTPRLLRVEPPREGLGSRVRARQAVVAVKNIEVARQSFREEFRRYLQIPDGEDTDAQKLFTVERIACLGCCSLAPVITIDQKIYGKLSALSVGKVLRDFLEAERAGKKNGNGQHHGSPVRSTPAGVLPKVEIRIGVGSCGIAAKARRAAFHASSMSFLAAT